MRVNTALGEYPFEFRRVERRGDTVAIVGVVAGLESTVVLERDDLLRLARVVAVPLAAAAFLGYRCLRR
ncbi:MAG: hypothetical protein U0R71_08440 [Solirubrobacterales bacterium]